MIWHAGCPNTYHYHHLPLAQRISSGQEGGPCIPISPCITKSPSGSVPLDTTPAEAGGPGSCAMAAMARRSWTSQTSQIFGGQTQFYDFDPSPTRRVFGQRTFQRPKKEGNFLPHSARKTASTSPDKYVDTYLTRVQCQIQE